MPKPMPTQRAARGEFSRRRVLAGALALGTVPAIARAAPAGAPIKLGVIAEMSTLPGAAIPKGAQMAADEINAKGGVLGRPLELVVYDDHMSSTEAVRAFQRLASQDKVAGVIASFISEVALALEPWAARLHLPCASPGAASNNISEEVHKDYERNKYTFHAYFTSYFIAESACDSAHDLLVEQMHMKTAAIMSEDAAWTTPLDAAYLEFLPKAGLEVVGHVRFSPTTTDFTPIFNKIEAKRPDVIMTGLSHVGVVPTVQWAEAHDPTPMYGVSSQATSGAFWKDTHGAAEGIVGWTCATANSAITPVTIPFSERYAKRFRVLPAYCGYTSYDMTHIFAKAIARAGSSDALRMVTALEATDHIGTIGRIKFYGRKARFTHAIEYGPDLCPGVVLQWQHATMETIWPVKLATAKISYPSFVRLPV